MEARWAACYQRDGGNLEAAHGAGGRGANVKPDWLWKCKENVAPLRESKQDDLEGSRGRGKREGASAGVPAERCHRL